MSQKKGNKKKINVHLLHSFSNTKTLVVLCVSMHAYKKFRTLNLIFGRHSG